MLSISALGVLRGTVIGSGKTQLDQSAAVTMSANTPEFMRALSILEYSAASECRTHELVPLF
jgi:hypothetical protein